MPSFQYPELFLLSIPLWFVYRRFGAARGITGALRITLLLLLLLALTGPTLDLGGRGTDVMLVVDRSRSMPDGAESRVRELIENLENSRASGDRLALITFGATAQVEHLPSNSVQTAGYVRDVRPDGSDLSDGLLTALNLVDPRRPARILVLSDGESNGRSPHSAARKAREAGVPVDFRIFERIRVGDTAITEIQLPESVVPLEQFQFQVLIDSDQETVGNVSVFRDGELLATSETRLSPGRNAVMFRDLHEQPGFYRYTVELEVRDDPVPTNNRGEGGLRVEGGPRILVLSQDGKEGNLVRALRAGQIDVDVAVASRHPVTQDSLDPYRAVILENVPARDLGRLKMDRLAQYVEDLGGGLLVTGGKSSFGTGGYFQSPLDPVLPISMELRDDNRKTRIALAIALDRSGSMTAPVTGNMSKMDLANLGTAECIKLLSPGDSVAVLAVDTSAHSILPLTDVSNQQALVSKVADIESSGGGIYVFEALEAAGSELAAAQQETRHIILFSDASDSEHPGNYRQLVDDLVAQGITVSVIGLGNETDPDAALLQDIAARGQGNIMFTNDPQELPRLFAEDTMSVARSSFVEADPETQPDGIPAELTPAVRLMGEFLSPEFPPVGGYNLSYLRPEASLAAVTRDEFEAPLSAFWYRGLGRVCAVTAEVDGAFTGPLIDWDDYADFLVTHARWLLGTDASADFYLTARLEGQDAVLTLELNPERPDLEAEVPSLVVVPPGIEREAVRNPDFNWIDAHSLEARFRLDTNGTWRTLLKLGDRDTLAGPAISLPYSPEFFPRRNLPTGYEVLKQVAEISGGQQRSNVLEVFRDPPRTSQSVSLLPILFAVALTVFLVEIAGRRLALWPGAAKNGLVEDSRDPTEAPSGWLPQWRLRREQKRQRRLAKRRRSEQLGKPQPPAGNDVGETDRIFEQAKKRARRRLTD